MAKVYRAPIWFFEGPGQEILTGATGPKSVVVSSWFGF
jgi:hypothetical protein